MVADSVNREYNQARRKFRRITYCVLFSLYILFTLIFNTPIEGWWLIGFCVGAVALEFWLWINFGLPSAAKKGSAEFKKVYFQ